jgi:tetratricopeptide (TPR) repeat protein
MKYKPTYQSGLTREQIDAYRNGSGSARRATEGKLNGSFEQDALDGWEESGLSTGTAMSRLDKRFRFTSPTPYIIGGITIVAGVVAALLLMNNEKPAAAASQKFRLSVEQSDAVISPSIDTLEELPASEQIHIAAVKTTQQEIKSQSADVPLTIVDELPPAILEPLKVEPVAAEQKISAQKTAKEIYLHDLKLVDYSAYRNKPAIEIERIILTGTAANYESNDQLEAEPSVKTVAIPYMDYIGKTMGYVSRGKWKQSLQRLQEILTTYPDDVNGHFYAGLCCYNLQQYEDAKLHFATCLQLDYNNFNEEATWYLAQSFLANGEKTSAHELLVSIRDQRGYYSKQAEKLLKGLK